MARTYRSVLDEHYDLALPADLKESLHRLAERRHTSMAHEAREALALYIEFNGELRQLIDTVRSSRGSHEPTESIKPADPPAGPGPEVD